MRLDFGPRGTNDQTIYKCSFSGLQRWPEHVRSYRPSPEEERARKLANLERLARAATPGPWHVSRNKTHSAIQRTYKAPNTRSVARVVAPLDVDAEYIAACSPEAILGLLDELKELRTAAKVAEFLNNLAKED